MSRSIDKPVSVAAVAIGSSTGGPSALIDVLHGLQGLQGTPQPIFITQHLAPSFTDILAQHLTRQSGVPCSEAIEGEIICSGHAYLAPRDRHLTLQRFGADVRVTLCEPTAEQPYCPAIDPMLSSLATIYGTQLCAVILTGMGDDGVKGAAAVKAAGGLVLVQDQASSLAKGMPDAIVRADLADKILPLGQLGPQLRILLQPALASAA